MMIRAGAAVCGPGDRLPCGTQQRIRLEPPLGQPPVLTNILINTILIMSLISLKPCTIISLMSSPTIRHTRTPPVEHSFPYYESHSHPKPHYQGQGAQNDLWGLFRSRYDAWCRPRWRYCCPAQPPLPSGLRRPLRWVFIMIAMLTPGYPTFHHLGDLTTSLTSPPPPPSLTSSQILLSPQFIFRSLETLSVIRTNYKCDCPSYVSLNTNSSTNSRCTLHILCSLQNWHKSSRLGKENSPHGHL